MNNYRMMIKFYRYRQIKLNGVLIPPKKYKVAENYNKTGRKLYPMLSLPIIFAMF